MALEARNQYLFTQCEGLAMQIEKRGKTCPSCHGSGHTKAGRPEVMVCPDPRDTNKSRHITKQRGSGCMKCLGTGVV